MKLSLRTLLKLQLLAAIIAWNTRFTTPPSHGVVLKLLVIQVAVLYYDMDGSDRGWYLELFAREGYLLEGVKLYPELKWFWHYPKYSQFTPSGVMAK